MNPIELVQDSVQSNRILVTFELNVGATPVAAVQLRAFLRQAGRIDRYSGETVLGVERIRLHTVDPHNLEGGDKILVEQSQAPEANGKWLIEHLQGTSFVLRDSHFQGNISAGAAASWSLRAPEFSQPATPVVGGNLWKAEMQVQRPGDYDIHGVLMWNGSPSLLRTPPKRITVP